LLVLIAGAIFLVLVIPKPAMKNKILGEISDTTRADEENIYTEYTSDSIYKIIYDSVVTVWDTRSGEKVSEFDVSVASYTDFPKIKQMELDPSGKYLAFLDNLNIVSIYNIFSGKCEGTNDDYIYESCHIYFTDDLKYLLMIDFREATVEILRCPNLEYLAYGEMGYFNSNLNWETENGKLIFYYEIGDSLFRKVFPADGHGDSLVFSDPVNVGNLAGKAIDLDHRKPDQIDP
jgi:hypothetical protein